MPLLNIKQPMIIQINDHLRLKRYEGHDELALQGYQDPIVYQNSEGIFDDEKKTDLNYVQNMFHYLNQVGELYFIEVLESQEYISIGDVTIKPNNPPIAIWYEKYRGKGIATLVMKAVISRLQELGYSKIENSMVYKWNLPSLQLHLKLGFHIVKETEKEFYLERLLLGNNMKFYCQLDYEHIPYPSKTSPLGNLANNGCGVCCASMIVENMTSYEFPPQQAALLAKACKAREGFGTNMKIFAPVFAQKFGLKVTSTYQSQEVLEFLQAKKGMVIANTIGNHDDWIGVFSDSFHYIVLCDANHHEVAVLDPMYRQGRYDIIGRKGKVYVRDYIAYADFSVIEHDCETKSYYMFEKIS